ncbi:hypothetical protein E2562_016762 [Oryza meyeriana var. granulata]|uniref:Retrotransposon gag domain-containing protein n=1 Tax=Oryza meyeriana var. granulata TaxID=110450 RepID=A0A6G1BLH7_9ORYZ|nr:hypothetical protein E2562_016762 [Oryza meyeriana var. granulata]
MEKQGTGSGSGEEPPAPNQDWTTGGGSGGRVPRYYKLDFLTFDGKDPLPCLKHCWLASYHMTGPAQRWHTHLEEAEGELTWGHLTDAVHLRFGPPLCTLPLGELTQLQRIGTVDDYIDHFLELLSRAGLLSPKQQQQLFIVGLGEPISIDVRIQKPADL